MFHPPSDPPSHFRALQEWRSLLLGLAIGIQVTLLVSGYILDHLQQAPQRLSLTAIERSGTGVFGNEGYAYLSFLQEVIPADAAVVIPKIRPDRDRERRAMWHVTGVMEHFLMPRRVLQCACAEGAQACLRCLEESGAYVLDLGDYPPVDPELLRLEYLPFEGKTGFFRGVFKPTASSGEGE